MLLYKEEAIKKILYETDKVLKSERENSLHDKTNMSESNIELIYKEVETDFSVSDMIGVSKLLLPPNWISLTASEMCHTPKVNDDSYEGVISLCGGAGF